MSRRMLGEENESSNYPSMYEPTKSTILKSCSRRRKECRNVKTWLIGLLVFHLDCYRACSDQGPIHNLFEKHSFRVLTHPQDLRTWNFSLPANANTGFTKEQQPLSNRSSTMVLWIVLAALKTSMTPSTSELERSAGGSPVWETTIDLPDSPWLHTGFAPKILCLATGKSEFPAFDRIGHDKRPNGASGNRKNSTLHT